jgi:arylsulfatase A-like enzyme
VGLAEGNAMTVRTILLLTCFCSTMPVASARGQGTAPPQRPNVVLVITDDMGWADLGSYGSLDIRTPSIDSLARDGVRLTSFYSSGVLCSPTRAGLISGRYQQRYGFETALPRPSAQGGSHGLPATGRTMPRLLQDGGYATALVGKWHLGYAAEQSPRAHGFGYFFGLKSGYHDYYTHRGNELEPDLWEDDAQVEVEGYTTDLLTQRAVAFIERQASRPFFLEVAYNAPLFNRKWTVWEGGIRVPALVKWPGRIQGGAVSEQVGHTLDLTASILAATGVPVPSDARLEGANLLPVLEGRTPAMPRTLFWRTTVGGRTQKAVRKGDWKLVVDGTSHTFLYDLRTDLGERRDLARSRQDVVRDLRPLLVAWEQDVDAEWKASGLNAAQTPR